MPMVVHVHILVAGTEERVAGLRAYGGKFSLAWCRVVIIADHGAFSLSTWDIAH